MANFVKRARMDDGWGARRQTPPSLMGSNEQQYGYSKPGQMQQAPVSIGELGSHVLLITVLNPKYPITVDVIHTICKAHGNIERIVIMKKSGVQALVEFDSVESAKRVKNALHGADIYSGCCTLNIGFAKPQRLNVVRNDTESWDYSPNFGMDQISPARGGALLAEPIGQGYGQNNSSSRPAYVSGGSMGAYGGADGGYGEQVDEYVTEELYDNGGYDNGGAYGNDGNGYMPQSQPSRGHGPRPLINPAQMGGRGGARGGGLGGFGGPVGRGGSMVGRGGPVNDRGGRGGPMAGRGAPVGGGRGAPMVGRGAPMAGVRGAPGGVRGGRGGPPSLLGQGMQRPGFSQQPMGGDYYGGGEGGMDQQGGVLMIYGLNMDRMNCNRVFNLFCLFGNITKVKFLKSKEGVAMIQMGDQESAEKAVAHLHNCPLFGSELHLSHSKQSYIQDVQQPYDLKDGAPSYKDFSASKNNRFQNADMASKNRVSPPSNVLYFYNSPPNMTEASLKDLFIKNGAKAPRRTKVFAAKSERSTTGLLEFDTKQDAVEALVLVNHQEVPNPSGRFPYVFKLCFSGASMDSER